MNPMERKEFAVRVALLINKEKIEPIQMLLATPEGGTKYVNVIVLPEEVQMIVSKVTQ